MPKYIIHVFFNVYAYKDHPVKDFASSHNLIKYTFKTSFKTKRVCTIIAAMVGSKENIITNLYP